MPAKNRVFISFAIEDEWACRYLAGQAKNDKSPFEFVDMSLKEPFDEKWKTQCRSRIKSCDGMIVLVSKNLRNASGALWEIKTAKEEKIPICGVYTTTEDRPVSFPSELDGVQVGGWTWDNIKAFLDAL